MRRMAWVWQLPGSAFAADTVGVQRTASVSVDSWQLLTGWLNARLFELGGVPVTTAGLIHVVIIISVAWCLSKLAQNALSRISALRPNFNRATLYSKRPAAPSTQTR